MKFPSLLRNPQNLLNLKNGMFGGFDYLVNVLVLFVLAPLVVRRLGVEAFGVFALANTVSGTSGVFALGLAQATLKFVGDSRKEETPGEASRIINATLILYCLIGFSVISLLFFIAPWMATELFDFSTEYREVGMLAFRLAGIGIFSLLVNEVSSSICYAFERYEVPAIIHSIFRLIQLTLQIVVLQKGGGLLSLIYLQTAAVFLMSITTALIALVFIVPGYRIFTFPSRTVLRKLVSYSSYTWFSNVLGAIRSQGDIFLVGAILGPTQVSYYTICLRLLGQVHGLLAKCFHFLFPYVGKLHSGNNWVELRRIYEKYTLIVAFSAMALVVPLAVYSWPILRLWMGPEIADAAAPIMKIMSFRFVVFPLSIVNSFFLLGTGEVKLMTRMVGLNCLISLGSIGIGATWFGLTGAAYGQLAFLPILLLNRMWVEHRLFHRARLIEAIAPVAICLLILTGSIFATADLAITGLNTFIVALAISIIGVALGGAALVGILHPYLRTGKS